MCKYSIKVWKNCVQLCIDLGSFNLKLEASFNPILPARFRPHIAVGKVMKRKNGGHCKLFSPVYSNTCRLAICFQHRALFLADVKLHQPLFCSEIRYPDFFRYHDNIRHNPHKFEYLWKGIFFRIRVGVHRNPCNQRIWINVSGRRFQNWCWFIGFVLT